MSLELINNEISKLEKLIIHIEPFDDDLILECKKNISDMNSALESLAIDFNNQLVLNKLEKIMNDCEQIKNDIDNENKRYQQFSKIKQIIMTSEYFIIDTVLSKINKKVNKILEKIFINNLKLFYFVIFNGGKLLKILKLFLVRIGGLGNVQDLLFI